MQAKEAQVTSDGERETQLECCHNLITRTKPEEDNDCKSERAMSVAGLINDLNAKITKEGAYYAQQRPVDKGIKVFGQKRPVDKGIKVFGQKG